MSVFDALPRKRWLPFTLLAALLALPACKSNRPDEIGPTDPQVLYERGVNRMEAQDWDTAIRVFEALTVRFPFAPEAQQARLDLIYAYFRGREPESAIDSAETYIRENPTSPHIDYAWYLKGLTDFERVPNWFERKLSIDLSARPPQTAQSSFASFRTIVEKFPRSEYAHDARRRMLYLRNRLADYEIYVADYYMERGAYVAAARRAENVIAMYDGAPAVQQALKIMVEAYDNLGLAPLAEEAREVYATNFPGDPKGVERGDPWWKFW